jgi:hypothetical protein
VLNEPLASEIHCAPGEIDSYEAPRACPCPLQMVRAHASTNFEHVPAGAFSEARELEYERLERVPDRRLLLETPIHLIPIGVDLSTGGFIPEGADSLLLLIR